MTTGIGGTLKTALRIVAGIKPPKLSLITADEQTRKSWAKALTSYDEVPDVYRDFLKTLPGGALPYMILTPSYEGFMSPTSERLLSAGAARRQLVCFVHSPVRGRPHHILVCGIGRA